MSAFPIFGRAAGLCLSGALLCTPGPAAAIRLNHQAAAGLPGGGSVEDKLHDWFDRDNTVPGAVSFRRLGHLNGASASLLNHRTALTAGHCLYDLAGQAYAVSGDPLIIGPGPDSAVPSPADRVVRGALAHPEFLRGREIQPSVDLGLVSLDAPLTSVRPVAMIAPGDALPPPGTIVRIAGYGNSAVANVDGDLRDGRRRVADTLYVERGEDGALWTQIRDPEGAPAQNVAGADTPLSPWEASGGGGDSGSPMFMVMEDGSLTQIGVYSSGHDGAYGAVSAYANLADHQPWIDDNNPLRHVTAAAGQWLWSDPGAWRDDRAAPERLPEAPNNRVGDLTAGAVALGRYYEVNLTQAARLSVDMHARIDRLAIANAEASLHIPAGGRIDVELGARLQAGRLQVDGVLATGLFQDPDPAALTAGFVQANGSVRGSGVIVANRGFVQHGGVVAPGGAGGLGTLTIDGDYAQGRDATLAVRVDQFGGSDRLRVTGQADVAGTLAVTVFQNAPVRGQSFTVLEAATVTGDFSRVETPFAAFVWTTRIQGGEVVLHAGEIDYTQVLPQPAAPGGAVGDAPIESARVLNIIAARIPVDLALEAAATVTAGDASTPSTPALAAASLNAMDSTTLKRTLVALPPSGFHGQSDFGVVTSRLTAGAIFDRLAALDGRPAGHVVNGAVDAQSSPFLLGYLARNQQGELLSGQAGRMGAVAPVAAAPSPTPFGVFVSGSHLRGGSRAPSPYIANGVTAGLDYRISSNITLGAALTWVEETRTARGARISSHAAAPTLYGRIAMERAFIDGYLGYAFANGKTRRVIPFGARMLSAESSASSGAVMAGVMAGVKLDNGLPGGFGALPQGMALTPFLGVDVAQMKMNGYLEHGAGALAVAMARRQFTEARLSAGLDVAWDLPLAGGVLTPRLRASLVQRVGDRIDRAHASYAAAPDAPFRLAGSAGVRTYGVFSAALSYRANEMFSASLAYQADVSRKGVSDNRLTGSASVLF